MKSVTIETKTFAEMLGITEGELIFAIKTTGTFKNKTIPQPHEPHKSNSRFLYSDVMKFIESIKDKKIRMEKCKIKKPANGLFLLTTSFHTTINSFYFLQFFKLLILLINIIMNFLSIIPDRKKPFAVK